MHTLHTMQSQTLHIRSTPQFLFMMATLLTPSILEIFKPSMKVSTWTLWVSVVQARDCTLQLLVANRPVMMSSRASFSPV